MRRECRERFPTHRLQRKPLVSDPCMHHGTCATHVPWCMSGSLTCGGGENVPCIPGACAPAILRIWQEAHGTAWACHGMALHGMIWYVYVMIHGAVWCGVVRYCMVWYGMVWYGRYCPALRGFWSRFGGVCSLTYCNGNFRVTMVSQPFNVIL